jgi:hypothetical protein
MPPKRKVKVDEVEANDSKKAKIEPDGDTSMAPSSQTNSNSSSSTSQSNSSTSTSAPATTAAPATASSKALPACQYGAGCYRKNPQHFLGKSIHCTTHLFHFEEEREERFKCSYNSAEDNIVRSLLIMPPFHLC